MHTVVETEPFQRSVKEAGVSETELADIIAVVAADPKDGAIMEGTGGARKLRVAGRGQGKRGGYRLIAFFGGDDVPVFLLDIYGKGEKDNLSKAERNALRAILSKLVDAYRAGTAQRTHSPRRPL
jgi:hypothetical protein